MGIDAAQELVDVTQSRQLATDYWLVQRVKKTLEALPNALKQVFRLLYAEGLSQREAASRLNISQPRIAKLHAHLQKEVKERLINAA
jgi:RNA polymerase sigma factor (sigma-70 family)